MRQILTYHGVRIFEFIGDQTITKGLIRFSDRMDLVDDRLLINTAIGDWDPVER
jgi:hypothetical protein